MLSDVRVEGVASVGGRGTVARNPKSLFFCERKLDLRHGQILFLMTLVSDSEAIL